jgi:hypothetical protein
MISDNFPSKQQTRGNISFIFFKTNTATLSAFLGVYILDEKTVLYVI